MRLVVLAVVLLAGCAVDEGVAIERWQLGGETVTLPARLDVPDHAGTYELRATVTVPPSWRGRPLTLVVAELPAIIHARVDGAAVMLTEGPIVVSDYRSAGPLSWRIPAEASADGALEIVLVVEHRWTQDAWWGATPAIVAGDGRPAAAIGVLVCNVFISLAAVISLLQLGLTALLVYAFDRKRRAYLWFAIQTLSAAYYPLFILGVTQVPFGRYDVPLLAMSLVTALVTSIHFTREFFELPAPSRWWWSLWLLMLAVLIVFHDPFNTTRYGGPVTVAILLGCSTYQLFTCGRLALTHPDRLTARLQFAAWIALASMQPPDLLHWLGGPDLPARRARRVARPADVRHLPVAAPRPAAHHEPAARGRAPREVARRGRAAQRRAAPPGRRAIRAAVRGPRDRRRPQRARARAHRRRAGPRALQGRARARPRRHGHGLRGRARVRRPPPRAQAHARAHGHGAGAARARGADRQPDLAPEPGRRDRRRRRGVGLPLRGDGARRGHVAQGGARSLRRSGARAAAARADRRRPRGAAPRRRRPPRSQAGEHPARRRRSREDHRLRRVAADGRRGGLARGLGVDRLAARAVRVAVRRRRVRRADVAPRRPRARAPAARLAGSRRRDDRHRGDPVAVGIRVRVALADPNLTRTGFLVGTPAYIAPELVDGPETLSPAADLFAFGVIAFELITGDRPFVKPAAISRMHGKEPDPPPPVAWRWPNAIPEVAAMIDRCLLGDPARRPTADEVAAVLLQWRA